MKNHTTWLKKRKQLTRKSKQPIDSDGGESEVPRMPRDLSTGVQHVKSKRRDEITSYNNRNNNDNQISTSGKA